MVFQFFVILMLVLIVSTSILSFFSSNQMLTYSKEAIAASALTSLDAGCQITEYALRNQVQAAARLATSYDFYTYRLAEDYASLNREYQNISNARRLHRELSYMIRDIPGAYSCFFYLDNSDYVISTDKGIVPLREYESLDWIETALLQAEGGGGIQHPRLLATPPFSSARNPKEANNSLNVVSYIYPLNKLTTSTRGNIVINIREGQFGEFLNMLQYNSSQRGYVLLDQQGQAVSHSDETLFLTDLSEIERYRKILDSPQSSGYFQFEENGESFLCAYSDLEINGWIYVIDYSMDYLLNKGNIARRNMAVLAGATVLVGAIIIVFLVHWMTRPMRSLVLDLQKKDLLSGEKHNEITLLRTAFDQLNLERDSMNALLEKHKRNSDSLLVHDLLRGGVQNIRRGEAADDVFPWNYFAVAMVSVDHYWKYSSRENAETKAYHRLLFIDRCEQQPDSMRIRCDYLGDGQIALVMNMQQEMPAAKMVSLLEKIQMAAAEIFGQSVTIGYSKTGLGPESVPLLASQAESGVKRRLVEGCGSLIAWPGEDESSIEFIYPYQSERRILNYLSVGNKDGITQELAAIREVLCSTRSISYDNILFIYNKLLSAVLQHLNENKINLGVLSVNRGSLYTAIVSSDTLTEIEMHLGSFFEEMIDFMRLDPGPDDSSIHQRVLQYLGTLYLNDVDFEEAAADLGVSYSYLRKLVRDLTGRSLTEHINYLRIRDAKRLLRETDLSITQIADTVGYHNAQSVNRWFHKFEGISPKEYRKRAFPASDATH